MLGGCEENALIFDQMIVIGAFMLKKWIKSDCLDLRFSLWMQAASPLKPLLTGPVLVKQMGEKGDHHNIGKDCFEESSFHC